MFKVRFNKVLNLFKINKPFSNNNKHNRFSNKIFKINFHKNNKNKILVNQSLKQRKMIFHLYDIIFYLKK
jgi:hypothetical protein